MNPVSLHLLVNHFPLIGLFTLTAVFPLLISKLPNEESIKRFYLMAVAVMGVYMVISLLTGDPAEHFLKDHLTAGAEFPRLAVHNHEEAAEKAMWPVMAAALLSLGGVIFSFKKGNVPKWLLNGVYGLSVVSIVFLIYVSHLGGIIRHPEITM